MSNAKPTKKQLEWADMEMGVLIHYLMEVYDPDFEEYKTKAVRTRLSPDKFHPTKLDPEQWVRAADKLGAKYAVLVVNHCDGFSLWQTKVNDYSCASMEWKGGKGDIFREFVDACKKYGIRPGVYYSTGCNGYYDINDEEEQDYKGEKYSEFVKCVERQITEIWSEYGEMFEIWFDGGVVPVEKGGPAVAELLKKYQPDAVTFQGPAGAPHNLRWIGNENGCVPDDCWGAVTSYDNFDLAGDPDGAVWMPAETDFPNRDNRSFGGGWTWKAGEEHFVLPKEELLNRYIHSVGRNSNMLIGMNISADGDFQDEAQFEAFGKLLKEHFGTPLAQTENIRGTEAVITVPAGASPRYLVICEDITEGHAITGFSVFADGEKFFEAKCVGHKRIIPLEGEAKEYRVAVTDSRQPVTFRSVSLF